MASENLFEDDFSEEIITELEQEYVTENPNVVQDKQNEETGSSCANAVECADVNKESSNSLIPSDDHTSDADSKAKLFQLPLTRIRNIMKLDPDLNIVSNEAVFLVTRATELFIESLAQESYSFTVESKKKTVQKRDVDLAIEAVDSLMFLDGAMSF